MTSMNSAMQNSEGEDPSGEGGILHILFRLFFVWFGGVLFFGFFLFWEVFFLHVILYFFALLTSSEI